MGVLTKTLYDTDFVEWTARTAELLRQGRFDELDLEHVAEEIEDLGKRDRTAARSQLRRLLKHLIKLRIQPERETSSWRRSIVDARAEIEFIIEDSPSILRHLEETLERTYQRAVADAITESRLTEKGRGLGLPEKCPWVLKDLLNPEAPIPR